MDKQTKSVLLQWIGPSALLVVALIIMVYFFSARSEANAYGTVTKNMTSSAENCLQNITDELILFQTVGEPLAALIEKEAALFSADTVDLLNIAMTYTDADEIYICDASGAGINSNGEDISIAEKGYFTEVQTETETACLFITDEDINCKKAFVVSVPINHQAEKAHMIFFYLLDNFEADVKKNDFIAWNMEALVDSQGTVLISSGKANMWVEGDDIYASLQGPNADECRKMKSRIANRTGGMISIVVDDLENSLVYIPVGIGDWTLITGIPQDYIDKLVLQQCKDIKSMMFQLIAVFFIFLCIVVGINIVSKLYNVRKQKQLEEKADTDLLTGLNNKLATERKIKEFIAKNPDAQSMMFILDIDNFKKINDTLGHAFGDEVLRSLGQQIGALFRATDIVGRAGGDEFIVFLKNITEAESVRKEAKKVEDFFHDFKAGEYTKYSATASIGVAVFPEEGENFESIYKAADRALYMAKERGKNQLAFYKEKWLKEEK